MRGSFDDLLTGRTALEPPESNGVCMTTRSGTEDNGTRLDVPLFTQQAQGFGHPLKYRRLLRVIAMAVTVIWLTLLAMLARKQGKGIDSQGLPNAGAPGYWGASTSNVNWCEEDYVVTKYIAEFGNSLSSMCMVASGLYGMYMHQSAERRFQSSFMLLIIVGFGSFGFHATLWRSWQLMDELPMVWGNGVFIYVLICMEDMPAAPERRWLPLKIFLLKLAMTVAIMHSDTDNQDVFLVCYGSGVAWIMYQSVCLNVKYNVEAVNVLQEISFLSYAAALCVWLVDRNFCAKVRELYLHAFWHFGAGSGTFTLVVLWVYLRQKVKGKDTEVSGFYPVHYVPIDDTHEKV